MKLGKQTGSFTNHILSRATKGQPEPVEGMGATVLGWTDRHPGTIVDVFTQGKSTYVSVQEDFWMRTDENGMSECQSYEYTPNPNGRVRVFRFTDESGSWREVTRSKETGRWKLVDGCGLRIGERDKYHDFSF